MELSAAPDILVAWKALAAHGAGCCGEAIEQLRQVPDDPKQTEPRLANTLCVEGQELWGTWYEARQAWLDSTLSHRRRLGMVGLDQDAAELRAESWNSMPDPQYQKLLELPDAERYRLIESLEAGILARRQSSSSQALSTPPSAPHRPIRPCETCGRGHRTGGRWCSRQCRLEGQT